MPDCRRQRLSQQREVGRAEVSAAGLKYRGTHQGSGGSELDAAIFAFSAAKESYTLRFPHRLPPRWSCDSEMGPPGKPGGAFAFLSPVDLHRHAGQARGRR